jgi:DNA-binding transcriptional LysR family regulator
MSFANRGGRGGHRGRRGARNAHSKRAPENKHKTPAHSAANSKQSLKQQRHQERQQAERERLAEEAALGPFPFGFVRGTSPEKWAERWRTRHPGRPLTFEPLGEFPLESTSGRAIIDAGGVLLVRAPSSTPPSNADSDSQLLAVRLYEEHLALLTFRGSEFEELDEVDDLALLGLHMLLDYEGHLATWPAPTEWGDPSWRPTSASGAAELVATGLGSALMPLTLARHIAKRREHRVVPLRDGLIHSPAAIYAVWRSDLDGPEQQELLGVLRGRTSRSSR